MTRLVFILLSLACTSWGQGFGLLWRDQPFLALDLTGPCAGVTFPQDNMETYTNGAVVNLLNGGCLWNGAYAAGTYTNQVNRLWYADAYTNEPVRLNLVSDGGTNWIWVITREVESVTEQSWTNSYAVGEYTNYLNRTIYADASDEYTDGTRMTSLALGGTNWIYVLFNTNSVDQDLAATQGWTNAYKVGEYTNFLNNTWFADAMDEYAAGAGVTNLVGGTNWIYVLFNTNSVDQDLAATQGWTNAYAAKDY